MIRTGMHTVQRLLSLEEGRMEEIERIEKSLQTWLKQQAGGKRASGAVAVALWPFRVARRSILASDSGHALSDQQMVDVLCEEVFGSVQSKREK
jgi:hypothetical protein